MHLSGAMGFSLFQSLNNKYILVFSDIHDGVSYCNSKDNQIADFLKSREKKNKILLEESTQEEVNLQDLWPNAKHTQELKKLAFESKDINSFDIRPLLLPFSWELIEVDKKLGSYKLKEYLKLIDEFFNKSSVLYIKYVAKEVKKLKFLNKKNNLHLLEILDQYIKFKKDNDKYMDMTLEDLLKKNIDLLHKINDIISYIMEWYIILLILNSEQNIIIHAGLAHSSRVIDMLKTYYKFKLIEQKGLNNIDNLTENTMNNPNACIMLPNSVTNKFNKKSNFFSKYF